MADEAELVQQEIEGVKFTPKASLDFDKIDSDLAEKAKTEGDTADVVDAPDDTKPKDEPATPAEEKKVDQDKVVVKADETKDKSAPDENEDVDLNDIVVSIGDKDTPVSEIVKNYQILNSKVEAIEKDEFLNKFIEHYQAGGDPEDYIRAKSDPTKVDDLTTIRNRFFSDPENKDFDQDVKEALFEKELNEKYGMNPDGSFDDEDSKLAKIGKQTMKRDADKVRATISEANKKFEIKRREEQKQVAAKVNPEDQLKAINELPNVKDLLAKKSVALEDGVSLPVDNPEKVVGMMADLSKFWNEFKDPNGAVNWNKVTKLMAFASDMAKYDKHLLSTGNDRGTEAYLKEQKNIGGQDQKVIDKSLDVDGLDLSNDTEKENFLKQAIAQKNSNKRR